MPDSRQAHSLIPAHEQRRELAANFEILNYNRTSAAAGLSQAHLFLTEMGQQPHSRLTGSEYRNVPLSDSAYTGRLLRISSLTSRKIRPQTA